MLVHQAAHLVQQVIIVQLRKLHIYQQFVLLVRLLVPTRVLILVLHVHKGSTVKIHLYGQLIVLQDNIQQMDNMHVPYVQRECNALEELNLV